MKIIVVGVGKVGATLVESFVKEKHDVCVVDTDSERVNFVVNSFDANGIVGGGLERQVLIEAGVMTADFLIACTSQDEVNILCCVLAKKLGVKNTVARVRDPKYFAEMENMREDLGLDFAFNPELQTALEIAQVLKFPSAKNVESFAEGKALLVEFDILANNPIIGKTLMRITGEYGFKLLFCMVRRGEKVFIPRGDFIVEKNDTVFIIAKESELTNFSKKLKIFHPRAKSVFIVGGGKVGYYLAKELLSLGINVKIIDKDKERCEKLSQELYGATILCGDGTDQDVLDEENLKGSDGCVTLTGIDEENVIISLYAQQKGVDKIITKIDRPSVSQMVKKLGLETVFSPRNVIANHIISYIRASQARSEEGIDVLYKLHDKVEAAEFTVSESFKEQYVPLSQLKIKRDVLVGGIVRDGEYIFPSGETCFKAGDRVIIVTTLSHVRELQDILRNPTENLKSNKKQ